MARIAPTLVALASLAAPSFAQEVWVVDADNLPGTDFTSIQPAVDAAADGDVVLVRGRLGHTYDGFALQNRSLTIVGEPDLSVPFPVLIPAQVGPSLVFDVQPDQSVVLRGLAFSSPDTTLDRALYVEGAVGLVLLEDLTLTQQLPVIVASPTVPALGVAFSKDVVLTRSTVVGSNGVAGLTAGESTAFLNASAFLHSSQLLGGQGASVGLAGPGLFSPAGDGGPGMAVLGSDVFVAGSIVRGGDGGFGLFDPVEGCFEARDGGVGAFVQASALFNGSLTLLDAEVDGGTGGPSPAAGCPAGIDGIDLELLGSSLTEVPTQARGFTNNAPVREDETLLLRFTGEPGDVAVLLIGAFEAPLLAPEFDGPLHVSPLAKTLVMGIVPNGGILDRTFTTSELGPGIEALELPTQAVFLDPAKLRFTGGDPSDVILLDRSF